MTEQEFDGWVRRHRFLYHVTARGSWSSISKHGLLTTNDLLNESGVLSTERYSKLLFRNSRRDGTMSISASV